MKKTIKTLSVAALAAMFVFALVACEEPKASPPRGTVINIAAIKGVIVPAYGLTPVSVISENEQYSGTVTWNSNFSTFLASTVYTATITLTAKTDYTLQGVAADFFTVAGATSVSNAANSGVITAVFPQTDSKLVNGIAIKTQPSKLTYAHGDALDLSGLVVTLTYDDRSIRDVNAENFLIKSITTEPAHGDILFYSTHNEQPVRITYGNLTCNTGNLSFTMPTFTSITELKTYLQSKLANTAETAYTIALNVNNLTGIKDALNATNVSDKYVYLDLSGSSITSIPDNAFYGSSSPYGCTTLTSITIPNSVISIGDGAFRACTNLTSVTIGNGVTSIGSDAFKETAWLNNQPDGVVYAGKVAYKYKGNMPANTSIILLNDTKVINDNAFYNCESLTSVTIPNSVTDIGQNAFRDCTSLASVTIPDSVTSIGDTAFNFCPSLASVTIPDSVISIGDGAFCDCSGLTSVTIGNGVTSIGDYAFIYCTSLTAISVDSGNKNYSSENGVLYNKAKTTLNQFPAGKTGSFTIPNSVTTIGDYAFDGCTGLASVTIPNSVRSIGGWAFSGCSGLTSVTIPNSVTSIGNDAFHGCSGLTSVTIGNGVTYIRSDAFAWCTSLASVTIGNGVTIDAEYAFHGHTSLTAISVDSGNKYYSSENGVLYNKAKTTLYQYPAGKTDVSFTIPNSVTRIEREAFYQCSGLTSVTIGNGVTNIESSAFSGCSGLTAINVDAGNTAYSSQDGVLYNKAKTILVKYPEGKTGAFNIPDGVTSIRSDAFRNCSGLTGVTIPDGVTSIGNYAFSGCIGLTSVTFTTGSNIADASFGTSAFPEGSYGSGGNTLKTAYATGKAGTYTRALNGYRWTKQ